MEWKGNEKVLTLGGISLVGITSPMIVTTLFVGVPALGCRYSRGKLTAAGFMDMNLFCATSIIEKVLLVSGIIGLSLVLFSKSQKLKRQTRLSIVFYTLVINFAVLVDITIYAIGSRRFAFRTGYFIYLTGIVFMGFLFLTLQKTDFSNNRCTN